MKGPNSDLNTHRFIVEQQAFLSQSLNDEINRIARLHGFFLGVIVAGISLGVQGGVITLGIDWQGNLWLEVVGSIPAFIALAVWGMEFWILGRAYTEKYRDNVVLQHLPSPFPSIYSDLKLDPNLEGIESNNELIKKGEEKVGQLHIFFLVGLFFLGVWGLGHFLPV